MNETMRQDSLLVKTAPVFFAFTKESLCVFG